MSGDDHGLDALAAAGQGAQQTYTACGLALLYGEVPATSTATVEYFQHNPLSKAFVRAAQELGVHFNGDFNGEHQEGVGCPEAGIVWSTYDSQVNRS